MKRKFSRLAVFAAAAIAGGIFSGCNESAAEKPRGTAVPESSATSVFVYENAVQTAFLSSLFAVDEAGLLYVTNPGDPVSRDVPINIYGETGELTNSFAISFEGAEEQFDIPYDGIAGMEARDGRIYLQMGYTIFEYDIKTEQLTLFCTAGEQLQYINKMAVGSRGIYVMGTPAAGSEHISKRAKSDTGTELFFEYDTREIYLFPFEGEPEKLTAGYPAAFDVGEDGSAVVYGFDGERGYYFAGSDGTGERIYADCASMLATLGDIDISPAGAVLSGYKTGKLSIADISGDKDMTGAADILDNVYAYLPADIKCSGEYIYYRTGESQFDEDRKIYRISAENALSKGAVSIMTSEYMTVPFSEGYEVSIKQLSEDMFALRTIAADPGSDISLFCTDAPYARNMEHSSAFYPLNDVPGAADYLDNCHPYIKDACTNEKGEIWALPISIDIPVMVCRRDNCEREGLKFPRDIEGFTDTVHAAYDLDCRYDCIRYSFRKTMLEQYLSAHDSFDTTEFRQLAEILKSRCPDSVFKYDYMIYSDLMSYNINRRLGISEDIPHREYDEIFFTLLQTSYEQTEYLHDDDSLAAAPLPTFSEGEPHAAVCTFMCVNAGSENLETALGYISALACRFSEKEGNVMLSGDGEGGEYMAGLREIYSRGKIYFAVPRAIYENEFDEYLKGDVSLEDFIRGADERFNLYLWEMK